MRPDDIAIAVRPTIPPAELAEFFTRLGLCAPEAAQDRAARTLRHTDLFVAAWQGSRLVGLVRALFDGVNGHLAECCLDPQCQGVAPPQPGAAIAGDSLGIGHAMGEALLRELVQMGAQQVSASAHPGPEAAFFRALGFTRRGAPRRYVFTA